jgi:hypothetical protein
MEKSDMDRGQGRIGFGALGEPMGVQQKKILALKKVVLEGRVTGKAVAD